MFRDVHESRMIADFRMIILMRLAIILSLRMIARDDEQKINLLFAPRAGSEIDHPSLILFLSDRFPAILCEIDSSHHPTIIPSL